MYKHVTQKKYSRDSIRYNAPIYKLILSDYSKIFSQNQVDLIQMIIKENIVKKIDSNFVTINNDKFVAKRTLDFGTYDIFPHANFNSLVHFLKISLEEGVLIGYRSDSLKHELSKRKLFTNYFSQIETLDNYNNIGEKTGFADTLYAVVESNSISLSENIQYKTITDSLEVIKYERPWMYQYHNPLSLLTVNFNYKAIGLDYHHYINEENYNIQTIWLDYNQVKELLIKRKVNFDVYESIFTKNLFDIFQINHEYWNKSKYNKNKQ